MYNYRWQRPLRRYQRHRPHLGLPLDLNENLVRMPNSWPEPQIVPIPVSGLLVYVKDRQVHVDENWNGSWVTVAAREIPDGVPTTGLLSAHKSGCSYSITFTGEEHG